MTSVNMLEGDSNHSGGILSLVGQVKNMFCELDFAYLWIVKKLLDYNK